jgi:Mce-associated membrane protein
VPPQRRNPGPPRRRPKIAGESRRRTESTTGSTAPSQVSRSSESDRTVGVDEKAEPDEKTEPSAPVLLSKKAEAHTTAEPLEKSEVEAVDPEATAFPPQAVGEERSGRPSWMPVVAVAVVAVVLGALAVVAALRPGASDSNIAWVDQAETAAVTEAAAHAIEAMHGYDFETIDEDFAEIRELLTDERRAEFDSTAQVTKDAAVQTRTVTEVNVAHIGARMIDESHAEIAAYINVSATGDGVAQGSAAAPLLVRMEKADGRWLVSEIRDQ